MLILLTFYIICDINIITKSINLWGFYEKENLGIFILLISYVISIIIGIVSFNILEEYINNIYLKIFIADVVATIIIWIIGNIFKTASVYDPYWSVQTVVISIALIINKGQLSLGTIIYLIPVILWAIRLTYNFIKTFNDLSYIDWRYKMLKEKTKFFYPVVNLLGIHLVPTIIVFLASMPLFYYIVNDLSFNYLSVIGVIIMIIAVGFEYIADNNMHKFIKTRKSRSEINRTGIWKYSRHPNYFGEILFWYGMAVYLILPNINLWYFILGAILNNALFLFISIPMAEKKMMQYKDNFLEYKKEIRMLIPIKKRVKIDGRS